jgi:hypothetical protein
LKPLIFLQSDTHNYIQMNINYEDVHYGTIYSLHGVKMDNVEEIIKKVSTRVRAKQYDGKYQLILPAKYKFYTIFTQLATTDEEKYIVTSAETGESKYVNDKNYLSLMTKVYSKINYKETGMRNITYVSITY